MTYISRRDFEIYKLATADEAPTLEVIGNKFGITRQRVSAIVKRVQANLGASAKELPSPELYPVSLPNFYVAPIHAEAIENAWGTNRSEKLRYMIDFYAHHRDRAFTYSPTPDMKYSKLIGGFCINHAQQEIIETVPEKSHAARMRHIISFYIENC